MSHSQIHIFCVFSFFNCSVLGSSTAEPELNPKEPEPKVQFQVRKNLRTRPRVWFLVLKKSVRTRHNWTTASLQVSMAFLGHLWTARMVHWLNLEKLMLLGHMVWVQL
jgi:hypothetical protein